MKSEGKPMTRSLLFVLRIGLWGAMASLLAAQEAPQPPKVLLIVREDIKEGKGSAHEQSESQFMRAAAAAKFPANILGMNAITGTAQAWFLEAYDSFESIGKSRAAMRNPELANLDALDGEFRSASRSWIAVYRPDLSFHGQQLMQTLPKMRYFNTIMMRTRQDRDQDFAEVAKMAVTAAERSMDDQPVATYQVVSGAPNGTYVLFEPSASLKALDAAPERSRNMFQAMGDAGTKRFMKMAGETIAQQEALLFAIDPKMSYVSQQIVAGDPAFWTPQRPEPAEPATDAKPAGKRSK
jgi:hypothetical protein